MEEQGSTLKRSLGLMDATMMVAGSMIGSGIFIVSADMSRLVGSTGWLLTLWVASGLITLMAALSYGELAGMMPKMVPIETLTSMLEDPSSGSMARP